jgi:hypothetical protein
VSVDRADALDKVGVRPAGATTSPRPPAAVRSGGMGRVMDPEGCTRATAVREVMTWQPSQMSKVLVGNVEQVANRDGEACDKDLCDLKGGCAEFSRGTCQRHQADIAGSLLLGFVTSSRTQQAVTGLACNRLQARGKLFRCFYIVCIQLPIPAEASNILLPCSPGSSPSISEPCRVSPSGALLADAWGSVASGTGEA